MDKHCDSTAVRGTCPECGRDDITIKKDGTLRVHSTRWWERNNCKGTGQKPKEG